MKRYLDFLKVARLDSLIRRAATGTPDELAKLLGMSRSSLFEMISFLKEEMGAPIIFNRSRPSYEYSYTPRFNFGFERERMSSFEATEIYGVSDFNKNVCAKRKNKRVIEIEIDDDEYIFEEDVDFTELYH